MRDPARIEPVLNQLRAAWERYPDMRLGQLVNAAAAVVEENSDPFSLEDELMQEGLRALAEGKRPLVAGK